MDDIIIHSPGLSQSGHACIFAAPSHIQLKELRPTVRSCDAWPTDTEDSPKVRLYRSKGRMIVTAIIAPTAWSWWWCSTSATQCRAKWAVHSRAAATVTARSSMVKLYLVIDFVLQIRCLWAGLSHLHQGKQAHSFISGPREVTSTLSNESCFDS